MKGKSKIGFILLLIVIVSLFLSGCYSSASVSVVQTTAAVETKPADDTEGQKNTIETTEVTVLPKRRFCRGNSQHLL